MSPSQVQRSSVTGAADALPLRSFTAVWAVLALFSGAFIVLAARGLSPAPSRADKAAAAPKGPTKEQVRQRQEHIALTERALELARKERKAAAEPASTPAPAASAPAAAAPAEAAPAPSSAKASSAGASAPAGPASSGPAEAAPAAPAAPAPAPAAPTPAAPTKPAAPSGLEGLKADVSFE